MINIHAAKTNLSSLLEQVENGEDVIIARAGKPIAKLVSYVKETFDRTPGSLKGKIIIDDSFDDPVDMLTWGLDS